MAGLPKLDTLYLGFLDGDPHLDQIHPSPITRTVVPSLTFLKFVGYCNYVVDLVALIDCPRLHLVEMWFYYNGHIKFQLSQLYQFIYRSEYSQFISRWAGVYVKNDGTYTLSLGHKPDCDQTVAIQFRPSVGWRDSHLLQMLNHFSI